MRNKFDLYLHIFLIHRALKLKVPELLQEQVVTQNNYTYLFSDCGSTFYIFSRHAQKEQILRCIDKKNTQLDGIQLFTFQNTHINWKDEKNVSRHVSEKFQAKSARAQLRMVLFK